MPDHPFDRAGEACWSPPDAVFECAVRASSLRSAVQASVVVAVMVLTVIGPSAPSFAGDESDATAGSLNVRPWIEIGGVAGDRDDGSSRLETSLFAPLSQDSDTLFFTQMDGRFFTDPDAREGNFAFGLRHVADDVILGGFLSYDGRYSQSNNYYDQVTLGGELLTEHFDIRANGYLPLRDEKHVSSDGDILLTNTSISMIAIQGYEVPLWGVDGEVSARLFESTDQKHQLWAGIGGYYFDSRDGELDADVFGPRGRLEYHFDSPDSPWGVTLSGSVSDDDMRGTRYEAGIRLRWMLSEPGERDTDPLLQRLSDRIYRDPDIVIGDRTSSLRENVMDTLTGVELERVAWASDSADLGTAVGAAAANTLLIVDQDYTDQQIIDGAENITIAGEQGTFSLTGVTTGTVVDYTVPGTRRSINVSVTGKDPLLGALRIEDYGEKVHLAGLDVRAENLAMTGEKEDKGWWQRLYGIYVDDKTYEDNDVAYPLYLEDLKGRAEAVLTTATTVYGNAEAMHITSGDVTVLDSDLSSLVSQKSGAQIESINVSSYGMGTSDNNYVISTIEYSNLSGWVGDLSAESTTDASIKNFVAGLLIGPGNSTVRNSTLTGSAGAMSAASTGAGDIIIPSGFFALAGSIGDRELQVSDSILTVQTTGDISATSIGGDVTIDVDWAGIGSSASMTFQNLQMTDSTVQLDWQGTASSSTTGSTQIILPLNAVAIATPSASSNTVTLTGNSFDVNFDRAANPDAVANGISAKAGGEPVTAIIADNSFDGDLDAGLNLGNVNDNDYTFTDSTGNTTASTSTIADTCYDGGITWAGEFELDGVIYDAAGCTD